MLPDQRADLGELTRNEITAADSAQATADLKPDNR